MPPRRACLRRPGAAADLTARAYTELAVEGRSVRLSSLDRVLWPLLGMSKGQLVDYYVRVAPALLPHLAERPLTPRRYPEGVDG